MASLLKSQGRYTEAVNLYKRVVLILKFAEEPGVANAATAVSLSNLGGLQELIGHYNEALPIYEQVLAIRIASLGLEHPDTSDALQNLSGLHRALPIYKIVMEIREDANTLTMAREPAAVAVIETSAPIEAAVPAVFSGSVGTTISGKTAALLPTEVEEDTGDAAALGLARVGSAVVIAVTGTAPEQEPGATEIASIQEAATGGPNTPSSIQDDPSLSEPSRTTAEKHVVQWAHGRRRSSVSGGFERARAILDAAAREEIKVVGINTIVALHRAAALDDSSGLPLYERAYVINNFVLGPKHSSTATSLNNLGAFYKKMSDYAQARPLYEKALGILEAVAGPIHTSTATCLHNLGGVHWAMGSNDDAVACYKRCLTIRKATLGDSHDETIACRADLEEAVASAESHQSLAETVV